MSSQDLNFETRTPDLSGCTSEDTFHVRTWFDHTRNITVVEVVRDDEPTADAKAIGKSKSAGF